VLGGEGLGRGSSIAKAIDKGLPVHILAYLSPAIIAESQNPAQDLSRYLGQLEIETKTFGVAHIVKLGPDVLSIPSKFIESYRKTLPAIIDPDDFRSFSGMAAFESGIQSFPSFKDAFEAMNLLADLDEWSENAKPTASAWGRFEKASKHVSTIVKVSSFFTERAHKFAKDSVAYQKGRAPLDLQMEIDIAEKLEKSPVALEAGDLQIVRGSTSLNALRYLEHGKRFLAGPVCFVIGACDLVVKFHEIGEFWKAGNTGKAWASGFEMLANSLIIYTAAVETVAWLFGLEALSAGPVGWIAAALILIGSLIGLISGEENDLQIFTKYCFLGTHVGDESDESPAWVGHEMDSAAGAGKALTLSALEFPRIARFALLRLISSFITLTGVIPKAGYPVTGVGGIIYPSYVPAGAYFLVQVDWVLRDGEASDWVSHTAWVWPNENDWVWIGEAPDNPFIHIVPGEGGRVLSIHVDIQPGRKGPKDYVFSVQLVYDSLRNNTLPARGLVVNRSVDQPASNGTNIRSSS
jgi:hypothetical protein